MRLYLTGADEYLGTQQLSTKSLGGFISSTELNHNTLNNLFSSISYDNLLNGGKEYRCLALKNESGGDLTQFSIWYDIISNDPISSFRIGIQDPNKDECENVYLGSINTTISKPVGINFINNKTELNKLIVDYNFVNNEYLGIWVERVINKSKSSNLLSCDYLRSISIDQEESSLTKLKFEIDFNSINLHDNYFIFYNELEPVYVYYSNNSSYYRNFNQDSIRILYDEVNDSLNDILEKTKNQIELFDLGIFNLNINNNKLIFNYLESNGNKDPKTDSNEINLNILTKDNTVIEEINENIKLSIEY